jgi:putative transposase
MAQIPRKWSVAQKLAILQEVEAHGLTKTCRKHEISDSMIYKWRRKVEVFGEAGLEAHSHRETPEFHKMADENRRLKQLVADQALELQLVREVLKKKEMQSRK